MADGPLYSKILVEDNGFYIMRNGDDTLATGVSFVVPSGVGLVNLTMPSTSGTLALTGSVGTVAADDITPGDASVKLTTTTGGLSIFTSPGSSLILGYDDLTQVSLGLSNMYLSGDNGGGYNIVHASQADGDDLTINHTGANASSLNLFSSGTNTEAIYLGTTAGGIKIDSFNGISLRVADNDAVNLADTSMTLLSSDNSYTVTHGQDGALTIEQTGAEDLIIRNTNASGIIDINTEATSAVKIQTNTYQYRINKDTSDAASNVIWSTGNLSTGTSSSIFVNSQFSIVNGVSDFASGYEAKATYYWDGATATLKSQQIISHGDTQSNPNGNGTALVFDVNAGTSLRLSYTPTSAVATSVRGLTTATSTN